MPWLPRYLLVEWAYGVLVPRRLGDPVQTEDYVAVVACAQDDHARLALASAPASGFSPVVVEPARRAVRQCLRGRWYDPLPSTGRRSGCGTMVSMAARPLTRGEIGELADRLRGLIAMVDNGEMSASTATRYRLQGAVVALETVTGHNPPLPTFLED